MFRHDQTISTGERQSFGEGSAPAKSPTSRDEQLQAVRAETKNVPGAQPLHLLCAVLVKIGGIPRFSNWLILLCKALQRHTRQHWNKANEREPER